MDDSPFTLATNFTARYLIGSLADRHKGDLSAVIGLIFCALIKVGASNSFGFFLDLVRTLWRPAIHTPVRCPLG